MTKSVIWNQPQDTGMNATLVLAHGAGAPMDSYYMQHLAECLAAGGLRVMRFEFPYMSQRRATGRKRPPDRFPLLEEAFVEHCKDLPGAVFVGGKSMGGRVASTVADALNAAGLICFGYPFHPPGKPGKTRTAHLHALATPGLILQGTRDPFGKPEEVADYDLASGLTVEWLESGDHDLKPLKSSGRTQDDLIQDAAQRALKFCATLIS
ncbi:MAG TPA: alpha/beta fold hydrolase [Pseudomonas xinjiangensis]|uniref:Alpha/beta fold hydrolase n=2 Tax=root TaxID=1 RepID=A0A7V1BR31_9GAMM|nr:alpha/beta fold hydrolase [Halopseudomonas xinjiangensis]HEC47227.1 alpha/beta fold hydrolase [Halopseudomonas xinjiangensis]